MRILVDNNIPYRFKREVADLNVTHVQDVGLADLLDGPLLAAIETRFDVLVTMDRSLQYQQNLVGRTFSIVVLRAKSNRLFDLVPLVSGFRKQLPLCTPPNCYEVNV